MMTLFVKAPPKHNNYMEERMNMIETLRDAIISIFEENDVIFNEYIDMKPTHTTAAVQSKLRRKQLRFTDMKKADTLHEELVKELLLRIIELKEEFEDLRCRMISPARIDMNDAERRCIFRTFSNRDTALMLMDFVRIYNKWTEFSADYLILRARREHEIEKLNAAIDIPGHVDSDKLTKIQRQLEEEYKNKLTEQETLLQEYCTDLKSIAEALDEQGVLDILDELNEDNAAIES